MQLVDAANAAGGRDNISVVLLRLEEVESPAADGADGVTIVGAPAVRPQEPAPDVPVERRAPTRAPADAPGKRRRRWRPGLGSALIAGVLATIFAGGYLASQAVYFVATADDGFVAVYRGVPVDLPAGISLYEEVYASGVSAQQLTSAQRRAVSSHDLRSRSDADDYVRQLEVGSIGP